MAEAMHLRERAQQPVVVVVVVVQPQLARWPQLAAWEHNRRLWCPLQRLSFDSANNESIANDDWLSKPAVGVLCANAALRRASSSKLDASGC